jgi:hypothetical protein
VARTGGTEITMNCNHEIMNMEDDFRYVTRERGKNSSKNKRAKKVRETTLNPAKMMRQ